MSEQGANDLSRMNSWIILVQSAQSHALLMAQMCHGGFVDLIVQETRKLCDQQPPSSDDELQARRGQRLALITKTGSVAHGDAMARMQPAVAKEILEATRKFCDRVPLTGDVHSESLDFVSEVSGICHRDLMRRLSG